MINVRHAGSMYVSKDKWVDGRSDGVVVLVVDY